jgi:hypothetical protein
MQRPRNEGASGQLETRTVMAFYLVSTRAGEVQSVTPGVGSQAFQDTSDFIYKFLEYFRRHPRLHTDSGLAELPLAGEVLVWDDGIEPREDVDGKVSMLGCIFNIEFTYRAILTYAP